MATNTETCWVFTVTGHNDSTNQSQSQTGWCHAAGLTAGRLCESREFTCFTPSASEADSLLIGGDILLCYTSFLTKKMLILMWCIAQGPECHRSGSKGNRQSHKSNTERGQHEVDNKQRRQKTTYCWTLEEFIQKVRTVASRGHGRSTPKCRNSWLCVFVYVSVCVCVCV